MNRRVDLASRFIDVENLPWEKTAYAGIEQKTLLVDKQTGLHHRADAHGARARLPDHEHVKIEQTYVLEGSLSVPEGECKRGSSSGVPRAAATRRGPGPKGGLFLAMFQIPNKFFQRDGRVTDFRGEDWHKSWGQSSEAGCSRSRPWLRVGRGDGQDYPPSRLPSSCRPRPEGRPTR
jgi:hypothetical protein